MKQNRIIRKIFYYQLFAYILSSLTRTVGGMIDGIIIGQCLGIDSIAAFGIISPLLIAFAIFGTVVSKGAMNQFTKLIGEGQIEMARGIFSLSLIITVGAAVLVMFCILIFSAKLAGILGASGHAVHLLPKARAYLIGIAIGLPAINAMHVLNNYMTIDNDINLPVIASAVLTIINIIFDLLVVFVIHGDTFEIGFATSISYYVAVIVLLLHFRKK
ncbi:MAG: hypothetical protein J6W76_07420, partial [Spirochaetales bacterium]|nr:hypothetical protein [Spirochaetales bacterium]